jgi:hypothetical protein
VRLTAAFVAALAAVVTVPTAAHGADNPLDRARQAMRDRGFTAHVNVRWVDGSGEHVASLDLEASSGTVQAAGPDGRDVSAWATSLAPTVPLAAKYWVAGEPGGYVAGRPTTTVTVLEGGALVERLSLDEETGIILRRERYSPGGQVERVVEVEQLDLTTPRPAPAPAPRLASLARLPAPFRAPADLGGGYRRVAAYRTGSAVQLVYSDGLRALSVFAQAGSLAASRLPDGAVPVRVGSREGLRYGWAGGEVVTWAAGGVVYTAVGDGPLADVLAAVASLPGAGPLPMAVRLRQACRALVETVTGGR